MQRVADINQPAQIFAIYFAAFTFNPITTSRRIASDRETSCAVAHASSAAIVAGSKRAGIAPLNFTPAGRPLDFLYTVFDCLVIIIRIHEKPS